MILFWFLHYFKNLRKNLCPPLIIPPPLQLSTVEYPFLLIVPSNVYFFHEVLIILTLGFIIGILCVLVMDIIITNNHTKTLTQTSVGLDVWRIWCLRSSLWIEIWVSWGTFFSINLLYKYKFSYIFRFFDNWTYFKFLTRI